MIVSEDEYYVLSELISMGDQKTAQVIELLIFPMPFKVNQQVMDDLVMMLKKCKTGIDFHSALSGYAEAALISKGWKVKPVPSEEIYPCRLQGDTVYIRQTR